MWNAVEKVRAVDVACDRLRAAVLSGELAAGSRLPAERQLAADLGISRLTLRAAIARLEAEGLVRPRHGSGVDVLDWRLHAGVALLPHLIARGRDDLLEPFLTLRRAVAAEAVAIACVKATDAELDALQVEAEALASAADHRQLVAGNLDFARRVVELADNLPMLLLLNTVGEVFALRPRLAAALVADTAVLRASFGAVVALLRTRDPARARADVLALLEAADRATLSRAQWEEPA